MVKIAIVDDEKNILELESDYIGRAVYAKGEAEIFSFSSAEEMIADAAQGIEFDILITDIKLSGMSGLELGKYVCEKMHGCYLVFLTSHSEFAAESYRLGAYQYILKGEMKERLPSVVEGLIEKVKRERKDFVLLGPENEKQKVYFRDILYVEKIKGHKYVLYVTRAGDFKEREVLKNTMERLDSKIFLFADRSYIVNMKYIEKISGDTIYLEGGHQLLITRTRLKKVKESLNQYWGCD